MTKTRHVLKETSMLRLYIETNEHGNVQIRTFDCTCGNVENDVEKALQDLRNLYQTEGYTLRRVVATKSYSLLTTMDGAGNYHLRSKGLA